MVLVGIDLALVARCARCSTATPVGGVRDEVSCIACGHAVAVGRPELDGEQDALLGALIHEPGEALYVAGASEAHSVAPACRSCHAALLLPPQDTTSVACDCGTKMPVRWPDAQTRGWDLRLTCIVGETEPVAPKLTLSGIVVPCGGCGAPLSGPIHDRSITCDHCGTANLLPEAIFLRLVPDAPPQPFLLVYDVDDALLAKVLARTDPEDPRWRKNARYKELQRRVHGAKVEHSLHGDGSIDLETARELAARDLTADEAKHVDRRLSNREREKLVGGRIAQALIALWSTSSDAGTRAVAARVGNPAHFVDDPDPEVRTSLAVRKHLPADVIAKLALDAAAEVRAAIARRKDCPVELLKKLGHDDDSRVAKAAHANAAFPPSLFKKLFGG